MQDQENRVYHLNSMNKVIHSLFYISVILGVVYHFQAVLPTRLSHIIVSLSIISGYFGILLHIHSNVKHLNRLIFYWLLLVMYMFIIGFINSGFHYTTIIYLVTQDIRYVMYFTIGLIYADKLFLRYYNKMIIFLGAVSILFAILALMNLNLKINLIATRQGIWTISYYYWWLSCSIFAYIFPYTVITGKHRLIGYGTLASYFILGLIFQKRSALINVIFIILITILLNPNKNSKSKYLNILNRLIFLFITSIFVIAVINICVPNDSYVGMLLLSLLDRFQDVDNVDRLQEVDEYFRAVSPLSYVLGQGIGNYITTNRTLNALHIGFYNTIYRGGILYLLFYFSIFIKAIKAFINRHKLSSQGLICLCTTLSAFLSMAYEFAWGYTIVVFGYATSMAYIYNGNIYKEEKDEDMLLSKTKL